MGDIEYIFKSAMIDSGKHVEPIIVKIPSNAIATTIIDIGHESVTWLEPVARKKTEG